MKKILLSLMLVIAACATALAAEVAFVAEGATTYTGTGTVCTLPTGEIAGTNFTAGDIAMNISNNGQYASQVNSKLVRFYAGEVMTLTASNGAVIKSVVAMIGSSSKGAFTATVGSVAGDGKTAGSPVTWTAGANDVVTTLELTAAAQVRFSYLAVTYEQSGVETVAKPVITPNGGKFDVSEAPVHVTIACDTEGAAISYAFAADGEFTAYPEVGFDV